MTTLRRLSTDPRTETATIDCDAALQLSQDVSERPQRCVMAYHLTGFNNPAQTSCHLKNARIKE